MIMHQFFLKKDLIELLPIKMFEIYKNYIIMIYSIQNLIWIVYKLTDGKIEGKIELNYLLK